MPENEESDISSTFYVKEKDFEISTKCPSSERDLKEASPMPNSTNLVENENDKPKLSRKLDWEALIAAAEEDFDLLESPVDAAAKTLKSGKEIQKLSIIRTMPETIATCGEDAISRLLPLIQDMITIAKSLDVHCDTSDLYKVLIKEKKYENEFPGLKDKLVTYILENVEQIKDNVAAAAWLETLLDITDSVPVQTITDFKVFYT
uniref:Uncharacterized protein n=1 Tax=Panagrolaimus sp. JU765 TaxID=591449 RepID=A0AC34RMR7_9BILA